MPAGRRRASASPLPVYLPVLRTMNESHTSPDDGFETALRTVIEQAAEDGADVEGAWKVSPGDDSERAWDVQIIEVEYDDTTGE